jgi:hypothetical protein
MATANTTKYSVIFVNNSTQTGSACMYQQDPDIAIPDVMSLAWFTKATRPTTKVLFTWSIDYNFVWSETGTLVPGVVFSASQTWDADLSTSNQVTFSDAGGAYTFQDQRQGARPGSLYITEDGTIPAGRASVGVGMSGFGTFAVQAQPNMNLVFTPHPEYWITFGNYVQGEVMDISSVNNPALITFPPNVYSMTAILNADNTWTIASTAEVNQAFIEGRERDPERAWGENLALPSPAQG